MELDGATRPERPSALFPRSGGDLALGAVMAIMSFLACLTLALALGAARLSALWEQGLAGEATVQIADMPGLALEAQVAGAMQVLSSTPGIAAARVLTREESADLLRPWLGSADLAGVPVPVLIALTLDPAVTLDADALRSRLSAVAPGAVLDDHSRWNAALAAASTTIGAAAWTILALIVLAAAASVAFATRAALQSHREVVDVLRLTGATPRFIGREVQWRFFRLAGAAAGLGLLAAIVFGMGIVWISGQRAGALLGGWSALGWIAVVPPAAALVATLTARLAVARTLAREP